MATASAALVACNAILGVEDVTLREEPGGRSDDDDGGEPDERPLEEAGTPFEDKGELALGFNHSCAR